MLFFDDHLQVITFWRRLGLQCCSPSLWRSLTPRFSACNDDDDINDNDDNDDIDDDNGDGRDDDDDSYQYDIDDDDVALQQHCGDR